jgi:lipopolysaccharide export system permease protein
VISFFFSNNVLPYSTSKARTLLYDIRRKKPDINIQAGTFYNGVPDFSIKVAAKDPVTNRLDHLIIYDHRERRGNTSVTVADSGYMKTTPDGTGLIMTLFNGYSFNEMDEKNVSSSGRTYPSRKDIFREQTIVIPLSGFDLERSQEGLFKSNSAMLNISELSFHIDSLSQTFNERVNNHFRDFKLSKIYHIHNYAYFQANPVSREDSIQRLKGFETKIIYDSLPAVERKEALTRAIENIKDGNIYLAQITESHYWEIKVLKRYEVEWNKKLTMSFACLVFFFIGAPLGAIIRKGGLGTPAVISIFFFVIYYVISLSGQKLVEENIIGTFAGMWAASYILLPIGIFLTYKATTDSVIMNIDTYLIFFKKIKDAVYKFTMNEKQTIPEQN